MGALNIFNLDDFDFDTFVETGTGPGSSFEHACNKIQPTRCFSVDMDEEWIEKAKVRHVDSTFYVGRSVDALKHWFESNVFKESDKILFFLDAHFPGSDYRQVPYDTKAPDALPLREELLLIKQYRPNCQDIIICDDARIYYQGPFHHGNTDLLADHGIDDIFTDRELTIDYRQDGFIIINPKSQ